VFSLFFTDPFKHEDNAVLLILQLTSFLYTELEKAFLLAVKNLPAGGGVVVCCIFSAFVLCHLHYNRFAIIFAWIPFDV
jgi:hypothetical protein